MAEGSYVAPTTYDCVHIFCNGTGAGGLASFSIFPHSALRRGSPALRTGCLPSSLSGRIPSPCPGSRTPSPGTCRPLAVGRRMDRQTDRHTGRCKMGRRVSDIVELGPRHVRLQNMLHGIGNPRYLSLPRLRQPHHIKSPRPSSPSHPPTITSHRTTRRSGLTRFRSCPAHTLAECVVVLDYPISSPGGSRDDTLPGSSLVLSFL